MVLAYSPSEWFVPSLQELLESKRRSVRRCVWHKSRRTPKSDGAQLVRCSNQIGEQDAKKADRLLRELPNVFDGKSRFLDIIQDLSPLFLCNHMHRASNASSISDFWAAESKLEALKPPREGPIQILGSSLPYNPGHKTSITEVQDQLRLRVEAPVRCHGKAKNGDCGNIINKRNGEHIAVISRKLAGGWIPSRAVLELLEELSGLVMCQRWHQDQAPARFREWTTIIKSKQVGEKEPQLNPQTINPQTPTRQLARSIGLETPETSTSSVWTSPRQSRSPLSTITNPGNDLSYLRRRKQSPPPLNGDVCRQDGQTYVSPTRASSRAIAALQRQPNHSEVPTEFKFEALSTNKSPLKAAEYVMQKIKENISVKEFPSGYVYGFRRPGCDLIKIGTTSTTVAQRLRSIETQCNYKPRVVFEVATNHAMKVERLVHRHLYRQRRRESLNDGRCNEGRGCATKHHEWFEGVSDAYGEAVIRSWVRWMDLEPYDAEGLLKPAWVTQTKLLSLNAPGDLWMRWTETMLVDAVKVELDQKAIEDTIKTEKVLRAVKTLSGQLIPPKPMAIPNREVRKGYSPFATLASQSVPVDVFA